MAKFLEALSLILIINNVQEPGVYLHISFIVYLTML
jgi:hypothetical protein